MANNYTNPEGFLSLIKDLIDDSKEGELKKIKYSFTIIFN